MTRHVLDALRNECTVGGQGQPELDLWFDGERIVRIVIAAMREPTPAMESAGRIAMACGVDSDGEVISGAATEVYRSMIDAALAENAS